MFFIMRYFLDTEFNGFGGTLISVALVPEHGDQECYVSLPLPDEIEPWVASHVVPYLRHVPPGIDHELERAEAADLVATYLAGDADPVIIADWPEDLAHFCALLVTGPGRMAGIDFGLKLELINAAGFSAAANSRVPHNALHDARALRDFYLVDRVG
ncbi:hypothetical protein C100_10230 [Sphingobium sp. C100]|nr:hypothetical protein C100_10230 [Sphingobium sp. C100]